MQEKKSRINKDYLWFVCDKCGTEYDHDLEEIILPEDVKGSVEWAYSPTSYENKMDALTKLTIREKYENKKCKGKG